MRRTNPYVRWLGLTLLAAACAGAGGQGSSGTGGAGSDATGGSVVSSGGSTASGGTTASGGSPGSDGSPASGGSPGSGGIASGGTGGDANPTTGNGGSAGGLGAGGGGAAGAGGVGGGRSAAGGSTGGGGAGTVFAPCPGGGAACVILPLGDSITYGYGSTTGGGYRVDLFSAAVAANKSITFVGSQSSGPATLAGKTFPKGNEGHSGYTMYDSSKTSGIAGAITDSAIRNYKPNIILLMIGTNDMHYSLDLANAPTRLGQLLDEILTDAPSALLVVATVIPANGTQNGLTQTFNTAIPGLIQARASQGKHIIGVDMYAAMKSWSLTIYHDSEHPNDAGYSIMANVWYNAIRSYLP